MPLIEVRGLSASYGPIQAVRSVDLDLAEGELVALLGANGAGKTTTLMSLSGLHASRRGHIIYDGADVSRFSAERLVRRGLVLAPEGRRIFAKLTVAENLALGAAIHRGRGARQQVTDDRDELLELFPILRERLHMAGGSLSGGEQQQLAIARALMSRPRVLLLDEPSLGLAPKLVHLIFELVLRLRNERGLTVLLVEQNVRAALGICDRAYVMRSGEIVLAGTADELRDRSEIERAYLGLSAERSDEVPLKGGVIT
jgi:branched-chain amino acid transport system ATP-binding protein